MSKQFQFLFDDEKAQKIEDAARDLKLRSGRAWILNLIDKSLREHTEAIKAFEQEEYVFLMKDGTFKRAQGRDPGTAWRSMGYTTPEAQVIMDSYKTLVEAKAEGWLTPGWKKPEPVSLLRKREPEAKENGQEPEADLPFGA